MGSRIPSIAAPLGAGRARLESDPAVESDGSLRSTAVASGTYFTSHLLLVAIGLVSLPIMTRLLSKADYGLLGLVLTMVSVLAVVGGLGLGEAVVRQYGALRADGAAALRPFCETVLTGAFAIGTAVALAVAFWAPSIAGGASSEYARCLQVGAVLIAARAVSNVLFQIYRAQERAAAHAAAQVGVRYATTALAIPLLVFYERTALIVLAASALVEVSLVGVRLLDLGRRGIIRRPRLQPGVLGAAVTYGLPLAVASVARFLLDYGDRFVVERVLGLDAVGTYAVAYDVATRLAEALLGPVQLAAVPILLRSWVEKGAEATARLASRLVTYMAALALPVALLYWALNADLIELLASDRYRNSSVLTPYLLPGLVLGGMNFIAVVGLTIERRTKAVALNVCIAALLNVAANLVLVPLFGLVGAALATTLAYAALLVANYAMSRRTLPLRLDAVVAAKALATATAMLLVVSQVGSAEWPLLANVAARGLLGAATIAAGFAFLDADVRRWCRRRLRRQGAGALR